MISESQIRSQLGRYLRVEMSLDHFEDWVAQSSWNMHKDSGEQAQKLASAIELRLAEHSSNHLDEVSLRDELRQLLNPQVIEISFNDIPPAISNQQPDNVVAAAPFQVLQFTVHQKAAVAPVQTAVEYAGTTRSVAHG